MTVHAVAPGVLLVPLPEAAVNAVVVHSGGEALVVDPGLLPTSAQLVRDAVEEVAASLVGVVVTHPHWDHAFGLTHFPGVPHHAHPLAIADLVETGEQQRAAMLASMAGEEQASDLASVVADLEIVIPDHPVAQTQVLQVGSLDVELEPIGHAHSAGDLVVHVRSVGVSIVGDLVEMGADPQAGDGDVPTWLTVLDHLEATAEPLLVPGHGEPTGHDRIAHHRELFASSQQEDGSR